MKTCYGYVRVSTLKQGDGVSLEAQRDAIEAFSAKNNIHISTWFEEKVTAAKRGRPLFDKMVGELKRGHAQGVVFHKIDRSARNFTDWARIGDLAETGVEIHFATESLDFHSRGGRLAADIQAVVAADYIRNLREECIKGLNGRYKQGLYPFAAPIGYLDNGSGKPKTIDPVRGPLIKCLFDLYASGEYSIRALAEEMERQGLRKKSGRPVTKTGIETILSNPFYSGLIQIRTTGAIYKGVHEPIVSARVFEQVRALREGKAHKKVTRRNHKYRRLLKCSLCSYSLTAELQKGRVYYRCHQRKCPMKTIREDCIENAFETFLRSHTIDERLLLFTKERFLEWIDAGNVDPAARRAPLEINKLDAKLSRLTDKLIDDLIDNETFQHKKKEILLEQEKWRQCLQTLANSAGRRDRAEKFFELQKSLISQYANANDEEKREIVQISTSNRTANATSAEFTPSPWLSGVKKTANAMESGHFRDTFRTFGALEAAIEQLEEKDFHRWLDRARATVN